MSEKRRSKKRLHFWQYLVAAVVFVFLVSLVGWSLTLDWKVFRPTVRAREGQVETAYSGTGLALRDETVVYAPLGGAVDQYVSENSRVPAGEVVVVVTDEALRENLLAEQKALEQRLADLATRNPLNKPGKTDQPVGLEEAEVRARLEEVNQGLTELRQEVLSPKAGIVSYQTDGLEKPEPKIAISNLLKVEKPLSSFSRSPASAHPTIVHRQVEVDKPLFKIIDSLQFWVVVDLPLEAEIEKGQRVKVRFSRGSGEPTEAEVKDVARHTDFLRAVLFFPDYQGFFTDLRWTELTVITSYHTGIIVPKGALRQEHGVEGVFVHGVGGVVFKPVKVIGQNQENVVVEGLAEDTRVIL